MRAWGHMSAGMPLRQRIRAPVPRRCERKMRRRAKKVAAWGNSHRWPEARIDGGEREDGRRKRRSDLALRRRLHAHGKMTRVRRSHGGTKDAASTRAHPATATYGGGGSAGIGTARRRGSEGCASPATKRRQWRCRKGGGWLERRKEVLYLAYMTNGNWRHRPARPIRHRRRPTVRLAAGPHVRGNPRFKNKAGFRFLSPIK
jgi:hypothetical protein